MMDMEVSVTPWETIMLGRDQDSLTPEALRGDGHKVWALAEAALRKRAFRVSDSERPLRLTIGTLSEFGLGGNPGIRVVRRQMETLGISYCPPETAVQVLRNGEIELPKSLAFAMEPIEIDTGALVKFLITCSEGQRQLMHWSPSREPEYSPDKELWAFAIKG